MWHRRLRCVVIGGGGHARVVIDALRASRAAHPCAILETDRTRWGTDMLGVPVIGGDEQVTLLMRQGIRHFVIGVGSVRDNQPRQRLFESALEYGLRPMTVCHPSAVRSPWAAVKEGTILLPGAILNAGARVGRNVILNTGAIVEHDCVIDDHAHVATGAVLCGGVRVGALAHVGAGATVRQSVSIGVGAVVGAGAVVLDDVAPGTVVVGVPAKPLAKYVESLSE